MEKEFWFEKVLSLGDGGWSDNGCNALLIEESPLYLIELEKDDVLLSLNIAGSYDDTGCMGCSLNVVPSVRVLGSLFLSLLPWKDFTSIWLRKWSSLLGLRSVWLLISCKDILSIHLKKRARWSLPYDSFHNMPNTVFWHYFHHYEELLPIELIRWFQSRQWMPNPFVSNNITQFLHNSYWYNMEYYSRQNDCLITLSPLSSSLPSLRQM